MSLLDVGFDVLKAAVNAATRHISVSIGDINGDGQTVRENVEWWQHVGFISMPSKADSEKKEATKVILLRLGGYDIAIGSRDKRGQELAGNLKPGETCIYAPGADGKSQARILLKDDGGIHLYSKAGNDEGGNGLTIALDAANNEIRLLAGGCGLIINEDGCTLSSGGAALSLESGGKCSLIGTQQCQVDGSTVVLGSIAAPVTNSVCVGAAGLIAVGSSKVFAAVA